MNEPVAWMGIRRHGETRVSLEKLDKDDIPLYTHPVKELTLDELKELFSKSNIQTEFSYLIVNFADAILKKAQEK